MLNQLQKEFYLFGQDGEKVVFRKPYLDDQKELTFLECEGLPKKGYSGIYLNEDKKALEFRDLSNGRKMLIHLQGKNEVLYREAVEAKRVLIEDVINFLKGLQSGKESLVIYQMNSNSFPLFITTETLAVRVPYSSKYTTGLLYCVNEQLKKHGKTPFASYNEMQQDLIQAFSGNLTNEFKKVEQGKEAYYTISLPKLVEIYVKNKLSKAS